MSLGFTCRYFSVIRPTKIHHLLGALGHNLLVNMLSLRDEGPLPIVFLQTEYGLIWLFVLEEP